MTEKRGSNDHSDRKHNQQEGQEQGSGNNQGRGGNQGNSSRGNNQ